jgi:hypothetical protein
MKISGNNFLSINTQTGISFTLDLSIDNLIGNCNFGFTGTDQNLTFKLNKGNIIDPNNRNVYLYNSNEQINISGNINENLYSYYINNKPCVLNGPTDLYNISGFYLNTNSCSADFNLNLYGDLPNYGVDFNSTFYITGNNPIIGIISNSGDSTFKIFSGVITAPTGFSVNGFILNNTPVNNTAEINNTTFGQISISHLNQTFYQVENSRLYNIQLELYTNFGKISKTIPITGAFSGYITVNLNAFDVIYPTSGSLIGSEDETNILLNTKIVTGDKFSEVELDKIVNIKLEYSGGKTGEFYANIPGSGYKSINVTGFLNGSGYLGRTDLRLTGYNLQSGSQITGYMTGLVSEQFFITGNILNDISLLSTGYFFDIPFISNKTYTGITGFANNGIVNYNNHLNSSFIQKKQTIENYTSPTSQFGIKVKSNESGSIVLVNAQLEVNANFSTGKVYLYTGNQGNLTLAKTYSGLLGDRNFGNDFYINKTGNCFLISCNRFGNQGNSGRVYLFENYNQNINTSRIIEESGLYFGKSVAINTGNIVFINNYNGTNNTGVINIYENNGPSFIKRQILSGYSKTNNFGTSLDTIDDGQLLIVSDVLASLSGETYIFTGNNYNYSLLNKLDKSGISGLNFFGYSLSLNKNGNILAVGDPYSNLSSGAFFIYTGDRNNNFKQVFASGFRGPGLAQLGISLKLNNEGNTLIAGLPLKDNSNGEICIITGSNDKWITTNIINQNTLNIYTAILGFPVNLSTLSGKNTYYAANYIDQRLHTFSDINFSGYLGSFIATGLINKTSNYLITGLITGNKYNKTFLNTFNILTGYYLPSSGVYTGFIDFKQANYTAFEPSAYSNLNNILIKTGINNLYLKVKTKNYYDDEPMTGKLTITTSTINGSNSGVVNYYITGKKV